MNKREQEYRKQVKLLKQRIARLEAKGYHFNAEELLRGSEKNIYYSTPYIKSLRGTKLIEKAVQETTQLDDFTSFMNEPEFEAPEDRDSPDIYSNIDTIEMIINQFPDRVVMQADEGTMGIKAGERDVVSTEHMGTAMWDVWNKQVTIASRAGEQALKNLDAYYGSIESELADLISPFSNEAMYFYESDLKKSFTEALRLLNRGVSLTMTEMEELSPLYTNYDNQNSEEW